MKICKPLNLNLKKCIYLIIFRYNNMYNQGASISNIPIGVRLNIFGELVK